MTRTLTCIACTPPTTHLSDAEYKSHLLSVHGAKSTLQAVQLEKLKRQNLPDNTPIPVDTSQGVLVGPGIEPSQEFIDIVKQAEAITPAAPIVDLPMPTNSNIANPNVNFQSAPIIVHEQPKEIKLEYIYQGIDSSGQPLVTLEADAGGKHFVIAYSISEKKQLEVREVPNLDDLHKVQNLPKDERILSKLSKKEQKIRPILFEKMQSGNSKTNTTNTPILRVHKFDKRKADGRKEKEKDIISS